MLILFNFIQLCDWLMDETKKLNISDEPFACIDLPTRLMCISESKLKKICFSETPANTQFNVDGGG